MKKIILALSCILFSIQQKQFAQSEKEGIILYEVKMNMHINLPKEAENMKSMIPEFNISKNELKFNAEESIFLPVEEDSDDDFGDNNTGGSVVKFQKPINEYYINHTTKRITNFRSMMAKEYLIEDTLNNYGWKLSDETMEIQKNICKKATFTKDGKTTIAWYAEKIPISIGPAGYQGLPGAILKLDINNGERVFEAKKITFKKLGKKEIQKPKKGTKVTEAEFKLQMQKQFGDKKTIIKKG
ncbi:MAG: GLPGLI family protein [Bacteroidetes bacterium]|nr:MAG: GLPGLI family protein [Bacteroidota bacterium]